MNLIQRSFNGHSIQVILDENGEPWFIAMEVAEVLGYSDAHKMTSKLDDDEKSNRQIGGLGPTTGGRGVIVINESGLYSAILTSSKPEAKPFKRWVTHDVLPTIRRTGSYSMAQQPSLSSANDATILIESMARTMNLAPAGVLGMYQRYAAKIGHADLLPVYAIDAPDGDTSSHTTAALATLIKKAGLPVTARKIYLAMQSAGLVERKERPSKTRGVKQFWALTEAGLKYGKNATNSANQLEVQVHIFESKFDLLLEALDMPELK
ncbi:MULTISPECIES: BRO-N domain-containing protein [Pseudomonas]|uniref:BRO-N domain-containing protein n=1 Tax=Pseudomonas TaxID=286 RepID=UPI000C249117|nr:MULTISPECIES: Bro-N domain-containing protein [Pseudomonas]MBI6920259.1 Bro-N domain-containing protein [Pseudomonas monteilii]MCE0939699.1 Bro-N domain-containing protein [Pseudomonas kurunegalensis]PJI71346.1 phage antirepressor [Pseudomonas sp. MR 02]